MSGHVGRHGRPPGPYRKAGLWAVLAVVVAGGAAVAVRAATSPGTSAAPVAGSSPTASLGPSTAISPSPTVTPAPVIPKPEIDWDPIPFPSSRKHEMAAYAREHYGLDTWRLVHPKVIVEHFTAGGTYRSAWSTFARDTPDVEFHSLPADCAHFVVDTDGTIHQLVPLGTMCRHTVGLNWTAVGIEMVGTSDGQILGNPRELRAVIRLTAWVTQRLHIQLRNVIGHNESLDSRYHRERVVSWRCQTHQDWQHGDMRILRADVGRYLRRFGIEPGPPWRAHPQAGC
jgi:N-acetylmuramoyl-L-alanine amidase